MVEMLKKEKYFKDILSESLLVQIACWRQEDKMLHGKLKIEICKTVLQILCKLGPSSLTYPLGIIFLVQDAVHHIIY